MAGGRAHRRPVCDQLRGGVRIYARRRRRTERSWASRKRPAGAFPQANAIWLSRRCTNSAAASASGACFGFLPSADCRSPFSAARSLSSATRGSPRRSHERATTSAATAGAGKSISDLNEDEERERIARAVELIARTTGERPLGWYCRYGPSENTRRLLVEEGGFLYDSDAYNDELPYWVEVGRQAASCRALYDGCERRKVRAARRIRFAVGLRDLSEGHLRSTL